MILGVNVKWVDNLEQFKKDMADDSGTDVVLRASDGSTRVYRIDRLHDQLTFPILGSGAADYWPHGSGPGCLQIFRLTEKQDEGRPVYVEWKPVTFSTGVDARG